MIMRKVLFIFIAAVICLGCEDRKSKDQVDNVIFIIGDGMGVSQMTALHIANDLQPLAIERATYTGLQKTYSANNRVTDSAASGTALATGTKTNNGAIGVDANGENLTSILYDAMAMGKATGVVVTSYVNDGTPAAFIAHSNTRKDYEGLAAQYPDCGVDIIAGAGREFFTERKDGRDLTQDFAARGYNITEDMEGFLSASELPLLMLYPGICLPYAAYDTDGKRQDYMSRMTEKSVALLEQSGKNGFFLMVEGSLIDWAAHEGDSEAMIGELRDFDKAVKAAFDYADRNRNTLVVVTGDHETGGLVLTSNSKDYTAGDSGVNFKYTTSSHTGTFLPVYAYGAGAENFTGIMDNTDIAKRIRHAQIK